MDVVREVLRDVKALATSIGFNPCSNGCRSGRGQAAMQEMIRNYVSILVLMDVVREVEEQTLSLNTMTLFQSLF